jgi:hypothetical protein
MEMEMRLILLSSLSSKAPRQRPSCQISLSLTSLPRLSAGQGGDPHLGRSRYPDNKRNVNSDKRP